MNWKDVKAELGRDPAFVREYEALEQEHQAARAIMERITGRKPKDPWSHLSLASAMRGMEDEDTPAYTAADLTVRHDGCE